MKVRLTRKYADQIDGIDLSEHAVGDVIDLPPDEARLILAEEWAHADRRVRAMPTDYVRRETDQPSNRRSRFPEEDQRALVADKPPRNRTP